MRSSAALSEKHGWRDIEYGCPQPCFRPSKPVETTGKKYQETSRQWSTRLLFGCSSAVRLRLSPKRRTVWYDHCCPIRALPAFDALGDVARQFHLKLPTCPVKTASHLRRLMGLVNTYGHEQVLASIARALEYQTYDAAYVETILLQSRRQQELPSPTPLRPKRQELIDEIHVDPADPASYDRLFGLKDLDDTPEEESEP